MSDTPLQIAVDGAILRITLDRPSHKNSLTPGAVRARSTSMGLPAARARSLGSRLVKKG